MCLRYELGGFCSVPVLLIRKLLFVTIQHQDEAETITVVATVLRTEGRNLVLRIESSTKNG
jgi:hypothetical protein